MASAHPGEALYKSHCMQCHGEQLQGGRGSNLADKTWKHSGPAKAAIANVIRNGLPALGMPGWKAVLTQADVSNLVDYIANYEQISREQQLNAVARTNAVQTHPLPGKELTGFSLPAGFSISVYAENVENARAMTLSPDGIVFVGSRFAGKVYAVIDSNKDFVADQVVTVADKLDSPIGVAFLNGALYVSEMSRVIRFDDIANTYASRPKAVVVKDDFPKDRGHGEKIIKAGPDGKLYVPIGAPCNVCIKEKEPHTKIWRMNPDGSQFEVYAQGVRNSVGFAWHPQTKELWFTDNGRDQMGDNLPPDELNHAPNAGLNFGFPYCHAGVVADPEFGKVKSCSEFVPPAIMLGPHVAPLGLAFAQGAQFPEPYRNAIFIAEHGSWNRSQKIGYRVSLVTLADNKAASYTVFAEGWLQNDRASGRPVDILFLADGSMLISDDQGGKIYRISYKKP